MKYLFLATSRAKCRPCSVNGAKSRPKPLYFSGFSHLSNME
ncbi:hypothetical protein SMA679_1992 [Streptococcus macedonicus]|nr:hypothetical protein SMA679_1992 [Streptococcus macedonicus]